MNEWLAAHSMPQITVVENVDRHGNRLTPQELTAMLSGGGIPGIAAAPADYDGQEDNGNEE